MEWRGRDEIDQLLERCRIWTSPTARIHALSIAARTLLYSLGAFRSARAVSEELLAESKRAGSLTGTAFALEQIADVQIAFGEFAPARENLRRAREIAAALGLAHRLHLIIAFVEMRLATYLDEDWESVARRCERTATDARTPWPWITIQAAAHAALGHARAGDREAAMGLIDELLPLLDALSPTTLNQNAAVPLVGDALWTLEDATRAHRIRELARELLDAGVGDYILSSNDLTVARMSSLLGDTEAADDAFVRAKRGLRADGRRPLYLLAVVDEAIASSRAGRLPVVAEIRAAAVELAGLGMTRWAARAGALADAAAATPPSGLTSREVEVLLLVAEGRTNREIAAALVLSVHTIERHLANCYRKIGARNRADATAFALRNL
jgi:DNA-binding NarL/FixJ family response regulator